MAKLGSIELVSDKNIKQGEYTKVNVLFSVDELKKEFELLEDVTRDKAIKVTVAKLQSWEAKANVTGKKGETTSCWLFLKTVDLSKTLKAPEDINRGDKVTVTFEAL